MELGRLLLEVENSIQEEANESPLEFSFVSRSHQHTHKPSLSPSSSRGQVSNDDPAPTTVNPSVERARGCKLPGCVVCLKGPPPGFEKGTPIWAQILHLVLYSLTESAKMTASTSPKAKIKKYFHLRDDIYEYINQHWDIICRRERIKNWRHTIGMTLSHYQKLFQNGYHIFQNTGYWSLKENVPSPYDLEGNNAFSDKEMKSPKKTEEKKRKLREKEEASNASPDSPVVNESRPVLKKLALERSPSPTITSSPPPVRLSKATFPLERTNILPVPSALLPSPSYGDNDNMFSYPSCTSSEEKQLVPRSSAVRFSDMKAEIARFKKEMDELHVEIEALQAQVRVKNSEEQLLKFLQEGIVSFRDRITQRIGLLRAEMINNHAEHQHKMNGMSAELTNIRAIGVDLQDNFQDQFARIIAPQQQATLV